MKIQKSIYERKRICEMNEREWKSYRRAIRLKRERRHKILVSMMGIWIAVCTVLLCLFFWNSIKSNASDGFKYYTSVTIESGDTLWNLADDYIDYDHYKSKDNYISEVRSINHLDESGSIAVGQLLIFPYYSDEYIK